MCDTILQLNVAQLKLVGRLDSTTATMDSQLISAVRRQARVNLKFPNMEDKQLMHRQTAKCDPGIVELASNDDASYSNSNNVSVKYRGRLSLFVDDVVLLRMLHR